MIVEFMEMIFRDGGVRPPSPLITSGSMMYLKAVLLEGEFVTSLPRGLATREIETGELVAFPHTGFWQPMDTLRDKTQLEALWDSGRAPWKLW